MPNLANVYTPIATSFFAGDYRDYGGYYNGTVHYFELAPTWSRISNSEFVQTLIIEKDGDRSLWSWYDFMLRTWQDGWNHTPLILKDLEEVSLEIQINEDFTYENWQMSLLGITFDCDNFNKYTDSVPPQYFEFEIGTTNNNQEKPVDRIIATRNVYTDSIFYDNPDHPINQHLMSLHAGDTFRIGIKRDEYERWYYHVDGIFFKEFEIHDALEQYNYITTIGYESRYDFSAQTTKLYVKFKDRGSLKSIVMPRMSNTFILPEMFQQTTVGKMAATPKTDYRSDYENYIDYYNEYEVQFSNIRPAAWPYSWSKNKIIFAHKFNFLIPLENFKIYYNHENYNSNTYTYIRLWFLLSDNFDNPWEGKHIAFTLNNGNSYNKPYFSGRFISIGDETFWFDPLYDEQVVMKISKINEKYYFKILSIDEQNEYASFDITTYVDDTDRIYGIAYTSVRYSRSADYKFGVKLEINDIYFESSIMISGNKEEIPIDCKVVHFTQNETKNSNLKQRLTEFPKVNETHFFMWGHAPIENHYYGTYFNENALFEKIYMYPNIISWTYDYYSNNNYTLPKKLTVEKFKEFGFVYQLKNYKNNDIKKIGIIYEFDNPNWKPNGTYMLYYDNIIVYTFETTNVQDGNPLIVNQRLYYRKDGVYTDIEITNAQDVLDYLNFLKDGDSIYLHLKKEEDGRIFMYVNNLRIEGDLTDGFYQFNELTNIKVQSFSFAGYISTFAVIGIILKTMENIVAWLNLEVLDIDVSQYSKTENVMEAYVSQVGTHSLDMFYCHPIYLNIVNGAPFFDAEIYFGTPIDSFAFYPWSKLTPNINYYKDESDGSICIFNIDPTLNTFEKIKHVSHGDYMLVWYYFNFRGSWKYNLPVSAQINPMNDFDSEIKYVTVFRIDKEKLMNNPDFEFGVFLGFSNDTAFYVGFEPDLHNISIKKMGLNIARTSFQWSYPPNEIGIVGWRTDYNLPTQLPELDMVINDQNSEELVFLVKYSNKIYEAYVNGIKIGEMPYEVIGSANLKNVQIWISHIDRDTIWLKEFSIQIQNPNTIDVMIQRPSIIRSIDIPTGLIKTYQALTQQVPIDCYLEVLYSVKPNDYEEMNLDLIQQQLPSSSTIEGLIYNYTEDGLEIKVDLENGFTKGYIKFPMYKRFSILKFHRIMFDVTYYMPFTDASAMYVYFKDSEGYVYKYGINSLSTYYGASMYIDDPNGNRIRTWGTTNYSHTIGIKTDFRLKNIVGYRYRIDDSLNTSNSVGTDLSTDNFFKKKFIDIVEFGIEFDAKNLTSLQPIYLKNMNFYAGYNKPPIIDAVRTYFMTRDLNIVSSDIWHLHKKELSFEANRLWPNIERKIDMDIYAADLVERFLYVILANQLQRSTQMTKLDSTPKHFGLSNEITIISHVSWLQHKEKNMEFANLIQRVSSNANMIDCMVKITDIKPEPQPWLDLIRVIPVSKENTFEFADLYQHVVCNYFTIHKLNDYENWNATGPVIINGNAISLDFTDREDLTLYKETPLSGPLKNLQFTLEFDIHSEVPFGQLDAPFHMITRLSWNKEVPLVSADLNIDYSINQIISWFDGILRYFIPFGTSYKPILEYDQLSKNRTTTNLNGFASTSQNIHVKLTLKHLSNGVIFNYTLRDENSNSITHAQLIEYNKPEYKIMDLKGVEITITDSGPNNPNNAYLTISNLNTYIKADIPIDMIIWSHFSTQIDIDLPIATQYAIRKRNILNAPLYWQGISSERNIESVVLWDDIQTANWLSSRVVMAGHLSKTFDGYVLQHSEDEKDFEWQLWLIRNAKHPIEYSLISAYVKQNIELSENAPLMIIVTHSNVLENSIFQTSVSENSIESVPKHCGIKTENLIEGMEMHHSKKEHPMELANILTHHRIMKGINVTVVKVIKKKATLFLNHSSKDVRMVAGKYVIGVPRWGVSSMLKWEDFFLAYPNVRQYIRKIKYVDNGKEIYINKYAKIDVIYGYVTTIINDERDTRELDYSDYINEIKEGTMW